MLNSDSQKYLYLMGKGGTLGSEYTNASLVNVSVNIFIYTFMYMYMYGNISISLFNDLCIIIIHTKYCILLF